ncbi:MAG: hypothetical protein R3C10_03660 [Pirellulales bacterium]|nr:hypothetical protein [Planctomycetales bacterium]
MSDTSRLETIKSQTLSIIADVTTSPKPEYTIDGQTVRWADYLQTLQATVDWCDEKLAGAEPFEFESRGYS